MSTSISSALSFCVSMVRSPGSISTGGYWNPKLHNPLNVGTLTRLNKGPHLKWMGRLEKNPSCKGAYMQTCLFPFNFEGEGGEYSLMIYNHRLECTQSGGQPYYVQGEQTNRKKPQAEITAKWFQIGVEALAPLYVKLSSFWRIRPHTKHHGIPTDKQQRNRSS